VFAKSVPFGFKVSRKRYQWAASGDVNAFFGLMLDNIADLVLAVSLLAVVFEFPANFAVTRMVPGTAIGVLVGDLLFFWMALVMARRTGRSDITAMPLGLDTPSTFGMVFFVLGPAFLHAKGSLSLAPEEAARYAWHIGICAIVLSGVFKAACAVGSGSVRRLVPRAGLLGSLSAVALVLISFMPLLEVLSHPIVGFTALAIILTTLVARIRLPMHIPGALGALLVAGTIFFLMKATGTLGQVSHAAAFDPSSALFRSDWLEVFSFAWVGRLVDSFRYLPIVLPFALGTVVGGIDCVESAAAAGDEFNTEKVIGVEALATLVAGLCGGVIQTTPYIGHPAYKAMGGRAAYVLATALFVGSAGVFGFFGYLYAIIPKAAIFPILVFIGLEITSQSFRATPKRHYPAVVLACVPALAVLVLIFVDKIFGDPAMFAADVSIASLGPALQSELQVIRVLASGFIVTSLLWASALAAIIDRMLGKAAVYFLIAAVASLFGVIHSPLPGSPLMLPWQIDSAVASVPLRFSTSYAATAAILFAWGSWLQHTDQQSDVANEGTD